MWADAAKWLAEFPEAVVTAVDADGYPVSVRQSAPRYDPATGRLPVVWPPDLAVAEAHLPADDRQDEIERRRVPMRERVAEGDEPNLAKRSRRGLGVDGDGRAHGLPAFFNTISS